MSSGFSGPGVLPSHCMASEARVRAERFGFERHSDLALDGGPLRYPMLRTG